MSESVVDRTVDEARRSSLRLPDGRSIDVWQAGPPEGQPLGQILDQLVAGDG